MEQLEVIERQIEPTLWDNRIIVVNKRSKIKIFIDPKNLNKGILREKSRKRERESVMTKELH